MTRKAISFMAAILTLLPGARGSADSHIDPVNKHAWSENVGWTNWRDAGTPAGTQGVAVHASFLAGFVWAENAGWINLGDGDPGAPGGAEPHYGNTDGADFGVNLDPATGLLSGLAWGENVGWINFDTFVDSPDLAVGFLCDGRLSGWVWGENVGWFNLSAAAPGHFVALDGRARPYPCDLNRDGLANGLDIQSFVDLLLNGGADWKDVCSGDVETPPDGALDLDDLAAFVACLVS